MVDYNSTSTSTSTIKGVHYEIESPASVIDDAVHRGFCPIGRAENLRKNKGTVGYVGRQGNDGHADTGGGRAQCHACHASHDFERKCGKARDAVGGSRRPELDATHHRGT